MKDNLRMLYNSLKEVETKGDSTKQMAICLQFLEGLINNLAEQAPQSPDPAPQSPVPEHVEAEVVE